MGECRRLVIHRIDDLEISLGIAIINSAVIHRIDDLERPILAGRFSLRVIHRPDDLEIKSPCF